ATLPQNAAGRMMEPPTWVPMAAGIMRAPTAAAEPEDDPPALRAGSKGLVVAGGWDPPSSAVVVLPTMTAPASRSAPTAALSRLGKFPAKASMPLWVGVSLVWRRSLTAIGLRA